MQPRTQITFILSILFILSGRGDLMAITNYERVGKALELLRDGLRPFVARELESKYGKYWITTVTAAWPNELVWREGEEVPQMDAAVLLRMMWDQWNAVSTALWASPNAASSANCATRNKWAHQEPFSSDDAYRALDSAAACSPPSLHQAQRSRCGISGTPSSATRWASPSAAWSASCARCATSGRTRSPSPPTTPTAALDSAARLLTAISAPQADEIEKMKLELLRLRFDEQVRSEKRKSAGTAIESQVTGSLKPWREVVTPHRDVASGRYQQAEFAADLWQVHLGEGTDEYRDPVEFFRRTYLTESLKAMLVGAVRRLAGRGGDPVVQLQTNFGGGKTHSMLALYHLFSGIAPSELPGIDAVMQEADARTLPAVRRVVLVGNKISPGNPVVKPDGTVVRTLWGELAWQLGGQDGLCPHPGRRREGDQPRRCAARAVQGVRPVPDPDRRVGGLCAPAPRPERCLARDLPAGGFETQFTFAQVLTESAKLAQNCLLVISLPASDTTGSPHTQADDVEVGGQRGREALDRLRNVVGRVESSWRPASAEEGFEIVRRRLFEPLADPAQFKDRDVVARAFADLYRTQHQEFPPECRDADYEKRIRAAYPIHPEIFDRLYTDWSTLVKFQRTRGVLRLMAAVIHSLWEKGDRNPLILPANIAIDDPRVQFELTRYLSDNWVPVIEKDVDGPSSLPLRLDGEVPNLGKFAACRRVARTIYLGSAPTATAAHRGIEDRRVKLGCVMPGESPAVFGDALRRLAGAATYLYQDGPRYWYSTQPTVTKLAEDRAEQLKRDPDKVVHELDRRLRQDLESKGDFSRIHPMPQSGYDVPDDLDARLVVLGVDHPYSKEPGNAAETAAQAILAARGNMPRLFRNTLVFLAADKTRLQDLDEAARKYLAWESILAEKVALNLDPQQVKQAETQKAGGRRHRDGAAAGDLPMAARARASDAPNPRGVAGAPADGAGCAGRARRQEAQKRRPAGHHAGRHHAAHVAGQDPALARRTRHRQAARRGLCELRLSAAAEGCDGLARRDPGGGRAADLGAGQLCLRRQPRRGRGPLSRLAERAAGDAGGRGCAGAAGEAGGGAQATGGRARRAARGRHVRHRSSAAMTPHGAGTWCRPDRDTDPLHQCRRPQPQALPRHGHARRHPRRPRRQPHRRRGHRAPGRPGGRDGDGDAGDRGGGAGGRAGSCGADGDGERADVEVHESGV